MPPVELFELSAVDVPVGTFHDASEYVLDNLSSIANDTGNAAAFRSKVIYLIQIRNFKYSNIGLQIICEVSEMERCQ